MQRGLCAVAEYAWPTRFCTRIVVDYARSQDTTLVDAEGKRYLDMFGSIASLPLGYNHPNLHKLVKNTHPSMLIHKPAIGFFPPMEYPALVEKILKLAELPHDSFYTLATGSEAVENAFKLSYLRRARKLREQGHTVSAEDMKIISLSTGFHGRTLGALSATHSNAGYKMGLPQFPWLKLPVGDTNEMLQTLDQYIEEELVAGCIIEPIQAEGGDVQLEPSLAREIRSRLETAGIPLIADEVQTGLGATGKMWGHQWWDLEKYGLSPPEFVTVSKKAQQAGVFLFSEDIPSEYYQIFNTWLGNPWDLAKFSVILETIHQEKLVEQVENVGVILQDGLRRLEKNGCPITNIRGRGTMLAFDVTGMLTNRQIVYKLEEAGVIVGPCGTQSVRIRPPLTATKKDAEEFLEIVEKTLCC